MTTYTPNLQIPLYESTDKPDLRDQYNNAMGIIDSKWLVLDGELVQIQNSIANLNTGQSNLDGKIEDLNTTLSGEIATVSGDVSTLKTTVDTATENITVLQTTSETHTTDITTINSKLTGLGIETADDAVDLKKDIDDNMAQTVANQADIGAIDPFKMNVFFRQSSLPGTSYSNIAIGHRPEDSSIIRIFGNVRVSSGASLNTEPILGGTAGWSRGVYTGYQLPNYSYGARLIDSAAIQIGGTNQPAGAVTIYAAIGSDGKVYLWTTSGTTVNFPSDAILWMPQCLYYFGQLPYPVSVQEDD